MILLPKLARAANAYDELTGEKSDIRADAYYIMIYLRSAGMISTQNLRVLDCLFPAPGHYVTCATAGLASDFPVWMVQALARDPRHHLGDCTGLRRRKGQQLIDILYATWHMASRKNQPLPVWSAHQTVCHDFARHLRVSAERMSLIALVASLRR